MRFLKRGSVRSSLPWRIGDSNGTDVWFSSGIRVWWIEIGREEGAGNFGYSAPWELEKVFLLICVELGTPPDHTTIWFLGLQFSTVCVMEACDSLWKLVILKFQTVELIWWAHKRTDTFRVEGSSISISISYKFPTNLFAGPDINILQIFL